MPSASIGSATATMTTTTTASTPGGSRRRPPTPTRWATASCPCSRTNGASAIPTGIATRSSPNAACGHCPALANPARAGTTSSRRTRPIRSCCTSTCTIRRRVRLAHQRHGHGHRLAGQRPGGRTGRRDLPGMPPELRRARRAAGSLRRRRDRRLAAERIRLAGAGKGLSAGLPIQFRPHVDAHQLLQRLGGTAAAGSASWRP